MRTIVFALLAILFFAFALDGYFGYKSVRDSEASFRAATAGMLVRHMAEFHVADFIAGQISLEELNDEIRPMVDGAESQVAVDEIRLIGPDGDSGFVWRRDAGFVQTLGLANGAGAGGGAGSVTASSAVEGGWLAEMDTKPLSAGGFNTVRGTQFVFGISLFLAFVLAVFALFLKLIVSPLERMTEICIQRRAGSKIGLDIKSDVKEVGELSLAMSEMIAVADTIEDRLSEEAAARTRELQDKVAQLEKANELMVGRELRMVELKRRIAELGGRGRPTEKDGGPAGGGSPSVG
jgi:hypothetical protein